ncbi:MAG TPA: putative baseplate assembly protein, partial [Anaerolineae bacterium]|nr:putative baseplate assembly protein [Anaerolineae bacterium]
MSERTENGQLEACGCCEDGVHEPGHENRPGLSSLSYRIGTHGTFMRRMLARLAREEIADGENQGARPLAALTTRSTEDPAIALLDAWATTADVLTFYQERIANEGYLRTATERRSVLELARAIGYELNPGVAASTYLAFTVDDSAGTPDTALIAAGTQVQSIPAKEGELPQTFETEHEFEARVEWNTLTPEQTAHHPIAAGTTSLYLQGVNLQLKPGDAILIVGPEREDDPENETWDVRTLKTVHDFRKEGYTRVTWEKGLGLTEGGSVLVHPAADATAQVYVFRKRFALFGHNAPDWNVMPAEVREKYCGTDTTCPGGDEWPNFGLNLTTTLFHIDGDHPEIVAPTWIALTDDDYTELYRVMEAVPSSRTKFAITNKTTRVDTDTDESRGEFDRRTAVVLAVPEELARAEKPLETAVEGNTIVFDRLVEGLKEGQPLVVCGKLAVADEDETREVA